MLRLSSSIILSVLIATSTVSAATLNVGQGSVSVNRGQGFAPVNGSTTVNPGDTVTVQPGGSAQIVYPDGSIQLLQPGDVATVADGAAAPAAPAAGGISPTTLVIGAVVVGAGIGVAILVSKSSGASP